MDILAIPGSSIAEVVNDLCETLATDCSTNILKEQWN